MFGQVSPLFNQWESIKQSIITGNNAQYKIRKNLFLGRGGFGIVFAAIRKQKVGTSSSNSYQEVVLKEFKKSDRWQSEEDWDKELVVFKKYLNNVKSDFILKIHDIFQEKSSKKYYLAMEYASGGSLFDRIKSPLPQQQILQFVKRGAQIFSFLHCEALQNFKAKYKNDQINDRFALIHRDFKPANLVFRNKNSINSMCIIDLGISKVGYVNTPMAFNNSGTNNYKAPQISEVRSYNAKVDIYSFGCTLYELFTYGQRLIGTIGVQKKYKERQIYIKNKLIDLQQRFDRTQKDRKIKYPNFWLQILSKCLAHDPKDRWSSLQLNKFVTEYSPDKFMVGAKFFGEINEQNKLARERKEIYEINFQIFRLNLIQQRIYSIFEHLYFNQPRLNKFMLYGILKYVIIFELQKFSKIKQKCRLLRRDDKLLLVKRLFEATKLDEIKKKAIDKMKNELEKERESYRGTASNDRGHIEQMTEKYPQLINQVSAQPRRTLYQFCFQERNAIMQDETFAKMIAQILVFMDELDWYNELRVDQRELENTDAELLTIKKLGKFRESIDQQLQQGMKKIFEGCRIEVSLKSGMNRQQARTDIALVPK